jgi:hypothetical protein
MAYVKCTKLGDIKGRQDYIMNEKRQEHIVLKYKENFDFSDYVSFEKEQSKKQGQALNQGRELIFALPNSWAKDSDLADKCKEIAKEALGKDSDYCFAVHWNGSITNLHLHVVFSERKKRPEKIDFERYKKDVWLKEDGTLAKSKAERHTLAHTKGDLKLDKSGDPIPVPGKPFSDKDLKYKSKAWLYEVRKKYQELLVDKYQVAFKEKSPMTYTQAEAEIVKRGDLSWKDYIRESIDEAVFKSETYSEFLKNLESRYVEIYKIQGKPVGYRVYFEYDERKVKFKNLGSSYDLERIRDEFKVRARLGAMDREQRKSRGVSESERRVREYQEPTRSSRTRGR